jgi:hypothetical protein
MEEFMRDDVLQALASGRTLDLAGRTVDITMKGRRSGEPRSIGIAFHWFGDTIFLRRIRGPHLQDWLANLAAEPRVTFHLNHGVVADRPAVATAITGPAERRRVLAEIVEQFDQRTGPGGEWPAAVLEDRVEGSPLAGVSFLEID